MEASSSGIPPLGAINSSKSMEGDDLKLRIGRLQLEKTKFSGSDRWKLKS
jgi:hypothetical protein